MMRPFRVVGTRFLVKAAVSIVLACTVFGFVVMYLWNWLTPPIFGWHTIGFWQAVGILILSRILFGGRGGFRRGRGHRGFRRWLLASEMSHEEREKFRQFVRDLAAGRRQSEPPKNETKPFESFG